MRYDCLKEFKDEEFLRLTGVKRSTFEKMVDILKEAESSKKLLGGRPKRLSIEDQLLMALEYIREYRTYFHVGASYQISESACYRNIHWIEDVLIKHPDFALPGRKAILQKRLLNGQKKTKDIFIQEKRKNTR
jgi:hypothetical protein